MSRVPESEWFIRGPVPWAWVKAAMRLRGSALHVAVMLLLWSSMRKSYTVKLRLSGMPIGRASSARGLDYLERAGLVRTDRKKGRMPIVTLIME